MLKGKTAVVTGGSRGIGKAICLKFAENGADIAFLYAGNTVKAEETVKELEGLGVKAKAYQCNVADADAVAAVVKEIVKDFGGIQILVNNAGITKDKLVPMMKAADFDAVIDTNLKGAFYMTKGVYPLFLKQKGGKIINIASMLSFQGGIRVPSYTASKSGVMGVTRLMANEWAKHNINVNAIAPGYMATNNTQQLRADEQRSAEILDRIPAGRWGLPSDLMGPVVFLASSASDYVNGYSIAVDGGWLAR